MHAEIKPQIDVNYIDWVQTVMWDDNSYLWHTRQRVKMLTQYDELGLTADHIHDRNRLSKVKAPPQPPGH